MDAIVVHVGDDRPTLYLQVLDARQLDVGSEVPIDLSTASTTVEAKFRATGTDTVLATIACTKIGDGKQGWVQFQWEADTLDQTAGNYEIEVAVDYNGSIQTTNMYFNDGEVEDTSRTLKIKVRDDF